MNYYLAIDIGASSGRHILGHIQNGKLELEEVYRFENGFYTQNGSLVWDIDVLLKNVKDGIKKCADIGKIPNSVAIDTWGVDYVLLDGEGCEILPAYCYRDSRTDTAVHAVEEIISPEKLYAKTGMQKQKFNTIYQLYSDKIAGRLDKAESFLMMPTYLSYKLTGVGAHEYTNASTSGLLNAESKTWDFDVIDKLGLPRKLFTELLTPTTVIGNFTDEVRGYVGFDTKVIFAPSHDTASAVAASPMTGNDAYISSGTWSLMGIESPVAITNQAAHEANFSNEGGIEYRFRFLKNYMGMWLLQNIRRNINKSLTYDEMMELAKSCKSYSYLDVNDELFVAPESMIEAIRTYFKRPDMELDEILASVYHSLAKSYKAALDEIEKVTCKKIEAVHIVGGGSKDTYLNELTHEYTGLPITAGPVEATAVGNLLSQLIADGVCENITEARKII